MPKLEQWFRQGPGTYSFSLKVSPEGRGPVPTATSQQSSLGAAAQHHPGKGAALSCAVSRLALSPGSLPSGRGEALSALTPLRLEQKQEFLL